MPISSVARWRGPAGSGKSTTLSCIIDRINKNCNGHIVTIEDSIEYLHRHDKSIVSQREVAHDTRDYASALRAVLRRAPNVILFGEMRDYETIATAMTAAETGQLVLSTLHTVGAANTLQLFYVVMGIVAGLGMFFQGCGYLDLQSYRGD